MPISQKKKSSIDGNKQILLIMFKNVNMLNIYYNKWSSITKFLTIRQKNLTTYYVFATHQFHHQTFVF